MLSGGRMSLVLVLMRVTVELFAAAIIVTSLDINVILKLYRNHLNVLAMYVLGKAST